MRKILLAALLIIAQPAAGARIECITAATIDGDSLSATAIRTKGKARAYNIEIYSSADAASAPTTCTAGDGTAITCAGWDTSGAAQIFFRCDRNAPFLQMDDTLTYTAAENVGRVLTADCEVRLKITATGAGGDVCLYLSISGGGLDSSAEVQDESTKGTWAVLP